MVWDWVLEILVNIQKLRRYFKKALKIDPNNKTTQNYLILLGKITWEKYSLNIFENPTKKPDFLSKI